MKYINSKGETFKVSFGIIEKGSVFVEVWNEWNYFQHKLKAYYRHERTWDDHMGNTPCGYYVNVPIPFSKKKRRMYIYDN